jgi:hypothetical protein
MTIFLYFLEVLEICGNSFKSPHTRPPSSSVVRAGRYSPLPATAAQHTIIFRRLSVRKRKKEEKIIPQKIITPSKTLNGQQQQQLKNDRKYAINQ